MTDHMLDIERYRQCGNISYEALRKAINSIGLPMKMGYTRKIFGTYLKQQGIDTEVIDLLQGRLPKSVFLRFYNRPNFADEIEKVRTCLVKLNAQIR
jgi:intergrase/recombinase